MGYDKSMEISTHGEEEERVEAIRRKSRKRQIGRPRLRCEENINIDLREQGFGWYRMGYSGSG
jgi:hypothetical protein